MCRSMQIAQFSVPCFFVCVLCKLISHYSKRNVRIVCFPIFNICFAALQVALRIISATLLAFNLHIIAMCLVAACMNEAMQMI